MTSTHASASLRILAAAAAAALLATACSSGVTIATDAVPTEAATESPTPVGASTSTPEPDEATTVPEPTEAVPEEPTVTPVPEVDIAADEAWAEATALDAEALGEEWTQIEPSPDSEFDPTQEIAEASPECAAALEIDPDLGDGLDFGPEPPVHLEDLEFERTGPNAGTISNTVSVFASPADAAVTFELIEETDYVACAFALFEGFVPLAFGGRDTISLENLAVNQVELGVGEDSLHVALTLEIAEGDERLFLSFDTVSVRVGRLVHAVSTATFGPAIDPVEMALLLETRALDAMPT